MPRPPTDYNEPRPGRVARTARWWYAPDHVSPKARKTSKFFLGFLGATLLAALLISFIPSGKDTPPPAAEVAASVPPMLLTSECAPAEPVEFLPEQVINTSVEPLWIRDGDMARPTSPTGGPFTGDPFPRCFSRTPEGALYSAASFATGVVSASTAGDLKPFFEVRASHSGNYVALVATLPEAQPNPSGLQVAISGYRWNSYSPTMASVEIRYTQITGTSAGANIATVYNLTWENNDWVLVVPSKSDVVQVPADGTYIPWGGTG